MHDETPIWRVMVRPRWVAALLLALAVSAVFAGLSQWQLERAVQTAAVPTHDTEAAVPLVSVAKPNGPISVEAGGRMVTVDGAFVPGDEQILTGRINHGESGYWVVSHFALGGADASARPVSLAVARGWTSSVGEARRVAKTLAQEPRTPVTLTGRLLPTEAPNVPRQGEDPRTMRAMSVAALYNLWHDVDGADVYEAYVIAVDPPPGLEAIFSPPPVDDVSLNWLNVFYAVEWIVFAGFAVYLWYRLVRDAKEREIDAARINAAEGGVDASRVKIE